MSPMQARILVAAIYFPLLLLSVFDARLFTLVVTVLLAGAWYEFLQFRGDPKDLKEAWERGLVILLGSSPPLLYFLGYPVTWSAATMAAVLQGYVILSMVRRKNFEYLTKKLGFYFFGFIYLTGLFVMFWSLRSTPGGREAIWFLMFVVGASDSVAYFFGKFWGRTAFFQNLSPKKTFEGFWGGLLGAMAMGAVFHLVFHNLDYQTPGLIKSMALALVVGIIGTFGDLFESMLKRNFGVKDSGTWFGAHGGVLDRFDALLFASVPVFFYIVVRGGFI